jgi:hypothetical protein
LEHNGSETGFDSVFKVKEEDTYSFKSLEWAELGPVIEVNSEGPYRIGILFPSSEDRNVEILKHYVF